MVPKQKLPLRVFEFDTVQSTQDEARKCIDLGENAPFWVIAEAQSQGRGRRGRAWQGARGNLFASLTLFPQISQAEWPKYSFLTAIGLFEALEQFGVQSLELKWPNDVLYRDHKISGILLETHKSALIIGIGVNLVDFIPEVETGAIAPDNLSHFNTLNATALFDVLKDKISKWERLWQAHGFSYIKTEYLARACKQLALREGEGRTLIHEYSIDDDGALVTMTKTGARRFFSADVVPAGGEDLDATSD